VLLGALQVTAVTLFLGNLAVRLRTTDDLVAGTTFALAPDEGPVPAALAALTVKVYDVPLVSPVTAHDSAPVVTHVLAPGLDVTVYFVIALPPLLAGAAHDTVAAALARVAETLPGAPGADGFGTVGAGGAGPTGTTATEASDAGPTPTAFLAVTVNEYAVPFARPVTVQDVPVAVHDWSPGDAVTVYPVMADPPLLTGAVQDTDACALPAVGGLMVGAPGTFAVLPWTWVAKEPVPTTFFAATVTA
jgi:hypothetical protein